MFRSGQRLGFFETGFAKMGPGARMQRKQGIFYLASLFAAPPAIVLLANHPNAQIWWYETVEPMWYPPQSDPTILKDLMRGKKVKNSSLDSYEQEMRIRRQKMGLPENDEAIQSNLPILQDVDSVIPNRNRMMDDDFDEATGAAL